MPTGNKGSTSPKVIEPHVNENRNIVDHEKLVIFADLVAKIPGRSIITNNPPAKKGSYINLEADNIGKGRRDVHFTFPKAEEGKKPFLTTSWTDIGGITQSTTTEGFGITNIDIQYDASFVPKVSIDFVDIRGKALFEGGRNSQYYGAFFNLPYPLFLLQFKGYYGDAVTYPLHLLKFNSKFNGETGNFEIKCDFIGHTFAFLSDMLLGYAIAAPYMTTGGENVQCGCGKQNIESIKEYIEKVNSVTADIANLTASTTFKDKVSLENFKPEIALLEDQLNERAKELDKDADASKGTLYSTWVIPRFVKKISNPIGDPGIPYNVIIDNLIKRYKGEAAFVPITEYLENMKIYRKGSKTLFSPKPQWK